MWIRYRHWPPPPPASLYPHYNVKTAVLTPPSVLLMFLWVKSCTVAKLLYNPACQSKLSLKVIKRRGTPTLSPNNNSKKPLNSKWSRLIWFPSSPPFVEGVLFLSFLLNAIKFALGRLLSSPEVTWSTGRERHVVHVSSHQHAFFMPYHQRY